MKVIDRSPLRDEDGSMSITNRLRGIWQFGFSWNNELQAQDSLIAQMRSRLKNKYTMLRSVILPGLNIPIPLILVGPSGVRVIYASAIKGIFRAKDETWAVMDTRSQHFKHSSPNLLVRASLMARVIREYLITAGYQIEEVEPVLFFSHPGFYVDTIRPSVRIVLSDAIDRLSSNISQDPTIFDSKDTNKIIATLTKYEPDLPVSTMKTTIGVGSLQLLFWQWFVLGLLVVMLVCIIMGFFILIIATT